MGFFRRFINAFCENFIKQPLSDKSSLQPNDKIDRLIKLAEYKNPIVGAIEESQNKITESWKNNRDVINGLEFCATLQLRTPLRVLLRHGEIHTDKNTQPPKFAREGWEGIWLPKTIFFEMLPPSTVASDIGPIHAADYLPFLITVRKILELNDSIENRIKMLREYRMEGDWRSYVDKLGGMEKIINRFFPKFIDTIPQINDESIAALSRLGLDTPNQITAAPDEMLLNIKGIGQAKLKSIRDYCAGIKNNRDANRFEDVAR